MAYFGEIINPSVVQDKRCGSRYGLPVAGMPGIWGQAGWVLILWEDGSSETIPEEICSDTYLEIPTHNHPSIHTCKSLFQPRSRERVFCSKACVRGKAHIKWPTADTLRELVWQMPTSQLSKQLGVSDVAIAKHCRNLGIPKPPRGYWSKVQSGIMPA